MRCLQVGRKLIGSVTAVVLIMCFFTLPLVLAGVVSVSFPVLIAVAGAPLAAQLICMAFSRVREYEADLDAARLMNSPMPLISALRKLENAHSPCWSQVIFNGVNADFLLNVFSSHPPTDERVRRLYEVNLHPVLLYT